METLTREIADEYRKRAMLLPANGLQDIGKRRELRKELQARCDLTELQAVQKFDNELVFMGEIWSGCKHKDEVLDWMRSNYEVESCLTAEVYRNPLGDCTNDGISSYQRELYVLAAQKGPFEPEDIRQCVYIEKREVMGKEYVDCKPAYRRKRWYMMGGNFLYTSDSRFKEITGISYPIAIHDRYEGR